ARLLERRSDHRQAGNGREPLRAVREQLVLVALHVVDADAREQVERRAEPNRIGDVAGARLEARRRALVDRALERDVLDHVAAALPRRHGLEQLGATEDGTDARRSEDLVTGEDEE